jgi:hypothetical protein
MLLKNFSSVFSKIFPQLYTVATLKPALHKNESILPFQFVDRMPPQDGEA